MNSPSTTPITPVQPQRSLQTDLAAVADFLQSHAALQGIEGYLHPLEGFTLMQLAAHAPGDGVIVEIGSFKGLSTCWLALGAKRANRGKVWAVDHFSGSPEHQPGQRHADKDIAASGSTLEIFKANIARAGIADQVEIIAARSSEAAPAWSGGSIRLLFIDGDHSYEESKRDFESWLPHVVKDGLIGFHDIGAWPGVTRFFNEQVQPNPRFRAVLAANSLHVVLKLE
jgi:predicted O-methyltransferase YrrM